MYTTKVGALYASIWVVPQKFWLLPLFSGVKAFFIPLKAKCAVFAADDVIASIIISGGNEMKRLIAFLAAAFAIIGLSGCGISKASGIGDEPTQQVETYDETSVVAAIATEPSTLHPFDHSAVVCSYMNQMTFNKLFAYEPQTLEPIPELVEDYTCADDGRTWDFTLKQGVYFHNGEEMTSADAVASLEYSHNFAYCSRYNSFYDSLTQTSEYTFSLTTAEPYSLVLHDLCSNAAIVVPKSLIEAGHDFNADPIGTGPYVFDKRVLGDYIAFTKNENYFDEAHAPTIDKITWRVIPEGVSRTIGLETGEIDLIIDVDPNDIARLNDNPDMSVITETGTRINFMVMNSERAPFDNLSFRKALNAAINREAVLEVAAGGLGQAAPSPNPQVFSGSTFENTVDFSPEQARQFIAQSGVDLELINPTIICYNDETRRSAEVIQGYLNEVGVYCAIETLDFAAFLSKMLEGDFDLAIAGYSSTNMLTYMKGLWHSASIGASNASRIVDENLDALIEAAEHEMNEAEREKILLEICRITNENANLVPLYTSAVTRAYGPRLTNVSAGPSGITLYQDIRIID